MSVTPRSDMPDAAPESNEAEQRALRAMPLVRMVYWATQDSVWRPTRRVSVVPQASSAFVGDEVTNSRGVHSWSTQAKLAVAALVIGIAVAITVVAMRTTSKAEVADPASRPGSVAAKPPDVATNVPAEYYAGLARAIEGRDPELLAKQVHPDRWNAWEPVRRWVAEQIETGVTTAAVVKDAGPQCARADGTAAVISYAVTFAGRNVARRLMLVTMSDGRWLATGDVAAGDVPDRVPDRWREQFALECNTGAFANPSTKEAG